MKMLQSIVVIDPVSSARRYGTEITKKGFRSVALVTRDRFPGMLDRLHSCDGFEITVKAYDFSEAVERLFDLNVKAILPGSDSALKLSDDLAQHFGLIGNPVATRQARTNKLAMKQRLYANGVPATISTGISLDQLLKGDPVEFKYPAVVKPCQGTGSKNVKICHSLTDVYKAVAAIESAHEGYVQEERGALIEAFIEGPEYFMATANFGKHKKKSILCFAEYEKIRVGNNPSVYKNIRSLSTLSLQAKHAFKYIKKINEALDADYGINDVEFKNSEEGWFIIEQNGRLPGANVPAIAEQCTGLNWYSLNLDIFLGDVLDGFKGVNYKKHFCICCLINISVGEVVSVSGVEKVKGLSSLVNIDVMVKAGDIVRDTQDFLSTWGFVYLVHENRDVLEEHSKLVHEVMRLHCR
jgi:biotin carboxylase